MTLLHSIQSETLKIKRGATLYFTLLAAAIVPIIFLGDIHFGSGADESGADLLNAIFTKSFRIMGSIFLPIFVIVVCTLLPQIEYRNNTWKQVFASPQSMANVYLAKYLQVQALILLHIIAFNFYMWGVPFITSLTHSELDIFRNTIDWRAILVANINAWISILAVTAVQFWLGLRFKSFLLPIGIGFTFWLVGIMLLDIRSSNANFFPYSFPVMSMFPDFKERLHLIQLRSGIYAAVILIIGFLDFHKRRRI